MRNLIVVMNASDHWASILVNRTAWHLSIRTGFWAGSRAPRVVSCHHTWNAGARTHAAIGIKLKCGERWDYKLDLDWRSPEQGIWMKD